MRMDWLLKEVSEDDPTPTGVELLTAIHESNNLELFDSPAVQALIRFFYQRLVQFEYGPFSQVVQFLDLF